MRNPRPFDSAGRDLADTAALIQDVWDPRGPHALFHVGDLFWRLRDPSYKQEIWLWEDEAGRLAGFAEWAAQRRTLDFQIHPRHVGRGPDMEMVAWAEDQAGPGAATTAYAAETDASLIARLEARGYRQRPRWTNYHTRSLAAPPETPPPPDGYAVRHLRGSEEIEARVAGHWAGWESVKMTVETYRRLMATPGYRPELDLVVVAPDGTFAATANAWLDGRSGAGLFEPISTAPAHRRRGVGRALIRYGLAQLRALGARTAWVGSDSGNPAATGLYESCGLTVTQRVFDYVRKR